MILWLTYLHKCYYALATHIGILYYYNNYLIIFNIMTTNYNINFGI